MKKFDIAVVGCTGKVGRQMITVLEERKLPYNNVVMFASAKSAGSTIKFDGKDYTIVELNEENIKANKVDIVLMPYLSLSGLSATIAWIVEQFGFAMIPFAGVRASTAFASGTTSGTSLSIRHWLLLSITIAPVSAKIGAKVLLVPPPADIKTMSTLFALIFSSLSSTIV